MTHILIAEDEERIGSFLEKGLRGAGYLTTTTDSGRTALLLARSDSFDLLVLDLGLPDLDGSQVLQRLRDEGSTLPVIVLTARDSVQDTVASLEGGASDYMAKPFQFAELLARIRLRLQEVEVARPISVVEDCGLALDLRSRRLRVDGRSVDLTAREFALMEVLLRHPDQVLTREQLLGEVWQAYVDPGSNVVDVFVRSLRRKIGAERIETVRGVGYRLVRQ
ncbi:response regulator transcription factor [Demetria terragena]|uniref:response regulator transcription factor n=1 Tax=Demetria terragena TaxID=63959 RepID=UPI00037087EA|nr:response regulator transcription factor [Demetria terragena]